MNVRLTRSSGRAVKVTAIALAALMTARVSAQTGATDLAQMRFDIVGIRLVVDPPVLTVPKNIATQINTSLALPPGIGAEARDALLQLTDGAVVEAELRGPSIPATRITVVPWSSDSPAAVRIARRLRPRRDPAREKRADDSRRHASDGRPATTIPIRVISEVFVTSVTSRPLSLAEIQSKGIVIDQNNFRAVNFQVAFNIDGATFTINLAAALPTPSCCRTRATHDAHQDAVAHQPDARGDADDPAAGIRQAGIEFLDRRAAVLPGAGGDGGIPPFDVPPVTGLVVIPGNVAFLNQFFSVLPDGDQRGAGRLAARTARRHGNSRVAHRKRSRGGTFEQPGDDPLRLGADRGHRRPAHRSRSCSRVRTESREPPTTSPSFRR
jgi:hypothetical protein